MRTYDDSSCSCGDGTNGEKGEREKPSGGGDGGGEIVLYSLWMVSSTHMHHNTAPTCDGVLDKTMTIMRLFIVFIHFH